MSAGRNWAYLGVALGAAASVAANVAHSYVPPAGAPADWSPQPGAVIGAVFWPVALLVAIEMMARVAWPAGRRWVAVRFGGLVPVASVAAVVSYRHMSGLLISYREDGLTATIGPLAIDGLMVMAAGALIATARPVARVLTSDDTADATEAATTPEPVATEPETVAEPVALRSVPSAALVAPARSQVTVAVPFGRREKGACDCGCGGKAVSYDTWKRHHPITKEGS